MVKPAAVSSSWLAVRKSPRLKHIDSSWLKRCSDDLSPQKSPLPGTATARTSLDGELSPPPAKKPRVAKVLFQSDTTQTAWMDLDEDVATRVKGTGGRRKVRGTAKKGLNDNFVRIDVEKKTFVRGKKKVSGAKVKRKDWKLRKSFSAKEAKLKKSKCRKCGEFGHLSMYCVKDLMEKHLVPENVDSSPFPTLEEAARMALDQKTLTSPEQSNNSPNPNNSMALCVYTGGQPTETSDSINNIPDNNVLALVPVLQSDSFNVSPEPVTQVQPLFDGDIEGEKEILRNALCKFGFTEFRPGQEEAITRVLRGLSTLLILGTGSGKSLCYQLPAYLYAQEYPDAISLCISPLVSLMEDQVNNMPKFLNANCIHTQMTTKAKEMVLEKIRNRKVNILLVSPEALCSGLFGLLRNTENFPPIAFACIDEVHCISEWSHNFRPSYLRVCKVLREKLNVKTILGLTATATDYTSSSICDHLKIDSSSKIEGELLPSNLNLSVSRDLQRDLALIELLHGERFKKCDSIIIYCTRRTECERIAQIVRTQIKPATKAESTRIVCEVYHAGMRSSARRRVQNYFMSGKTRIVVATVAFGMGINKSDIRAIIHYNMPKTFESYVQEIGRAGRDGLPADCHLFLDSIKGKDMGELKRHIYTNYVDRSTLRKLLKKILQPCKCSKIEKIKRLSNGSDSTSESKSSDQQEARKCGGHEVSFSIENASKELDLEDEIIETLLCYLELDTKKIWIEVLPKCYHICKVQSYGGPMLLRTKAQSSPALAAAIAHHKKKKKFKDNDVFLEFNMIELASSLDWNSAVLRRELKGLEWTGVKFDNNGKPTSFRKSGLLVEFSDLAYRMVVPGDLTDEDHDYLLNYLHNRCVEQEKMQVYQLQKIHQAFQSVSTPNILGACDSFGQKKSASLKEFIHKYFKQSTVQIPENWKIEPSTQAKDKETMIRQDVMNLLSSQRDTIFTGRAVAKIFQGISSPCFPAEEWNRNKTFWRRYLDVDFHSLVLTATEEIVKFY